MDIADMIVSCSAEQVKKESEENACDVTLRFLGGGTLPSGEEHYTSTRNIRVAALNQHVMLQFDTLNFKVSRSDKAGYSEVLEFLFSKIEEAVRAEVQEAQATGAFENNYGRHFVTMCCKGKVVFSKRVWGFHKYAEILREAKSYMAPLIYIN